MGCSESKSEDEVIPTESIELYVERRQEQFEDYLEANPEKTEEAYRFAKKIAAIIISRCLSTNFTEFTTELNDRQDNPYAPLNPLDQVCCYLKIINDMLSSLRIKVECISTGHPARMGINAPDYAVFKVNKNEF